MTIAVCTYNSFDVFSLKPTLLLYHSILFALSFRTPSFHFPSLLEHNLTIETGAVITSARSLQGDALCDNKAFQTNYANCLQCAGPDNEDIWKYYGNSAGAAGTRCGLSTTPLSGEQDDVPAAVKDDKPASSTGPSATPSATPSASPSATPSSRPSSTPDASAEPSTSVASSAAVPASTGAASSALVSAFPPPPPPPPPSSSSVADFSSPSHISSVISFSVASAPAYGYWSSSSITLEVVPTGPAGTGSPVEPTGIVNGTVSTSTFSPAIQTVNAAPGVRVGGLFAVVLGAFAALL